MFAVVDAAADAVRSRLAATPLASGASNIAAFDERVKVTMDQLLMQQGRKSYDSSSSMHSFLASTFSSALQSGRGPRDASDKSPMSLFVGLLTIACTLWIYQTLLAAPRGLKPPNGSRIQIIRSWLPALGQTRFYGITRGQWVKKHMGDLGEPQDQRAFRMNVSKYVVSIVHGTQGARDFFSSRHLNFYAGFAALFSGIEIPNNPSGSDETDEERSRKVDITLPPPSNANQHTLWQIKHLRNCLSNRRLTDHDVMAKVASDCWKGLSGIWRAGGIKDPLLAKSGTKGMIEMHSQLYEIMFRISVRVVGATEMAEAEDLRPVMKAYWTMENNQSFTNTLMSNMPTPSNRKRKAAARELQRLIRKPIDDRIASGQRHDDYPQILLDHGADAFYTTIWVTMVLFASIINTSSVFAWTLTMSSANADIWKRLQAEVDETLARIAIQNGVAKDAPAVDKIASMSIEQLEDNFAYTYWCIRETIRILLVDFSYRRIDCPSDSITVGGQQVRRGEYMAFCIGTLHRDGRVYTNPERYDPDRWVRGEASKPFEFMGWGGGSHPCIGMKLAKNELKLAVAMFVACNDIRPVDLNGNAYKSDEIPLPDLFRGGYRLPSKPLRLEYTVRHA